MFRKLQYILATLLTVATCNLTGGNSVYATDISDALIYNSQRFLATDQSVDVDGIVMYFVNVYVYENGAYKKLTPNDDFTYTMSDAAGNEYYTLEDYGKYQLTITGTGDYTGSVSQSMYKVEGGNWDNYKAESFSNIDNDNQVITIMNEAEFALLSYRFHSVSYSWLSGWTFLLDRDLDMSAHSWNPIGCPSKPGDEASFQGHFDGQGHTISGINVIGNGTSGGLYYRGLFGEVDRNSSIQNFTLTESTISSGKNSGVGGIVGVFSHDSYIQNCHITNSVQVLCTNGNNTRGSGWCYGGIVGYSYGSIKGCTCAADVFMVPDVEGIQCGRFGGIIGGHEGSACWKYVNRDNVYYGKHVYCTEYASTIAGHIDDEVYYVATAFQNNTYVPGVNASLPAIGNSTASDSYPSALLDVNDIEPSEFGTKVNEYKYNDLSLTVYSNAMVQGDKCFMRNAVNTRNGIRAFNSGDESTTDNIQISDDAPSISSWYTIDGHHLPTPPTTPGLYILNGKKVMIR